MRKAILARLTSQDRARLKNASAIAQKLENKWDAKISKYLDDSVDELIDQLKEGRQPKLDLERFFIEHYFQVHIESLKIAQKERELEKNPKTQLGIRFPKKMPKSLAEIMKLYDLWRKGQFKPKAPAKQAEKIKKKYLDKVQSVWHKYSKPFREGDVFTQNEIRDQIKQTAETTKSRAKTIVRTETTKYYNQVRRAYYDESPDVTHYLFLAIRDNATTRWCSAKTTLGMRGRHGLVYKKDAVGKETPPCHWNCRSEIVPLTIENPAHKKLIEDKSIQRQNVKCWPLPKGWA